MFFRQTRLLGRLNQPNIEVIAKLQDAVRWIASSGIGAMQGARATAATKASRIHASCIAQGEGYHRAVDGLRWKP